MAYALHFDRRVEKELKALPSDVQRRVLRAFVNLQKDPTVASKKLVGEDSYRVVYDVDTAKREATVLKVAHRKDVYRRWDVFVEPKSCMTCELTARRHQGPLCERIYEDEHWRVAHAFDTSLPGWLVVIAKRHVASFAELSDAEALSFGPLLHRVSRALRGVTGAVKTYTVLFAEHPEHPHVHIHVIPRMADIPDDKKGPRVFGYLGVPEAEIVPLETRNALVAKLQALLQERTL